MSTHPTNWNTSPTLTRATKEPTSGAHPCNYLSEPAERQNAPTARRSRLTGDRNECPSCGLLFNSTHAFDKHRTGRIGVDRRCMTMEEMQAAGMARRADGFWVGSLMRPDATLRARDRR